MRSTGSPLKRLTFDAMLIGVAMMISYLEAILPLRFVIPLPGVKLGLANLAVMIAFFAYGASDAGAVSLARLLLTAMLFGNAASFLFSALGGLCAFCGLLLYKLVLKRLLSPIGASILCAALHNTGQLVAAGILLSDAAVVAYAPIMLTASVFCGALNGILLVMIIGILPEVKK